MVVGIVSSCQQCEQFPQWGAEPNRVPPNLYGTEKDQYQVDTWLVVTGTMEFYNFPFSWEFHHPN